MKIRVRATKNLQKIIFSFPAKLKKGLQNGGENMIWNFFENISTLGCAGNENKRISKNLKMSNSMAISEKKRIFLNFFMIEL